MKKNRFLCLTLAIMMLLSVLLPSGVFAEDEMMFEDEGYENVDTFASEEFIFDDEAQEPEETVVSEEEISEPEEALIVDEINEEDNLPADDNSDETLAADEIVAEDEILTNTAPSITSDPQNVTAAPGTTVSFTVVAENAESYQWFVSTNGGSTYSKCSSKYYTGVTTATLTLEAKTARDGFKFACKVTGDGASVTSKAAVLTVAEAPVITSDPQDVTAAPGTTVTFSVVATNAESYQWYYSANGGTSYKVCSSKYYTGVTTDTLTVEAKDARNGVLYLCKVTGSGVTVESAPATLTVAAVPVITSDPQDVTAAPGTNATFTVVAENAESYQWFVSTNGGSTYSKCSSKYYTGVTTATLTVEAKDARNGCLYLCKVTGGGVTVESKAATLTVAAVATITSDPVDVTAAPGATVTFSVVAKNAESYQWYVSANGGSTYSKCTSKYYSGVTTDTLTVEAKAVRNGYKFACKVTGGGVSVTSKAAVLTVAIIIDDVTYEQLTNTTCRVKSYAGTAASLTIPETVEGMTVVEIGEEAFMGNTKLTSIDLPDSITIIRARAFKGCTKLSSMS